jgi:hypothetical protein
MVGFSFQEEATDTENDAPIIHLSQQQEEMGRSLVQSFLRHRIYIHLNANSHYISSGHESHFPSTKCHQPSKVPQQSTTSHSSNTRQGTLHDCQG